MKKLRCAIYTRKSSEEGLDQAFNSLHAQREACEAYIKSQAGEGWTLVKTAYDDGGFSGGSMERPALKALLQAVDEGLIDVVVVYKVDRLTRALADFARIVDRFDAKGISFVSVTQAFNTTTSMGRLTLNVLLSFAQFEREVTGERIRDKVAASKAKGMWMGGTLPLGYDLPTDLTTRALVMNAAEADTVRLIFNQYLKMQSVHALKRWLDQEGVVSKRRTARSGEEIGGNPFSRGALFHLLKNRVYVGQIVHRGVVHEGAHPAIVELTIFEQVQALLQSQTMRHNARPTRVATAELKGLLFDAAGEPMSPVFTHGRTGRVHRYYVSAALQQGCAAKGDSELRRVPGLALDALAQNTCDRLAGGPANPRLIITRLELHGASIQFVCRRHALPGGAGEVRAQAELLQTRLRPEERLTLEPGSDLLRITLPYGFQMRGGRTWVVGSDGKRPPDEGADKPDAKLVRGLRAAHDLAAAQAGSEGTPAELTFTAQPKSWYERSLLRLIYLAPDIQKAVLEGRQPAGLMLEDLVRGDIPAAWAEQRKKFGFPATA